VFGYLLFFCFVCSGLGFVCRDYTLRVSEIASYGSFAAGLIVLYHISSQILSVVMLTRSAIREMIIPFVRLLKIRMVKCSYSLVISL